MNRDFLLDTAVKVNTPKSPISDFINQFWAQMDSNFDDMQKNEIMTYLVKGHQVRMIERIRDCKSTIDDIHKRLSIDSDMLEYFKHQIQQSIEDTRY